MFQLICMHVLLLVVCIVMRSGRADAMSCVETPCSRHITS